MALVKRSLEERELLGLPRHEGDHRATEHEFASCVLSVYTVTKTVRIGTGGVCVCGPLGIGGRRAEFTRR